jgi:hypothetical protein
MVVGAHHPNCTESTFEKYLKLKDWGFVLNGSGAAYQVQALSSNPSSTKKLISPDTFGMPIGKENVTCSAFL